jgi:hypothetical protein
MFRRGEIDDVLPLVEIALRSHVHYGLDKIYEVDPNCIAEGILAAIDSGVLIIAENAQTGQIVAGAFGVMEPFPMNEALTFIRAHIYCEPETTNGTIPELRKVFEKLCLQVGINLFSIAVQNTAGPYSVAAHPRQSQKIHAVNRHLTANQYHLFTAHELHYVKALS